jgi:ABC-type molybdate transport system ATPase subunit
LAVAEVVTVVIVTFVELDRLANTVVALDDGSAETTGRTRRFLAVLVTEFAFAGQ